MPGANPILDANLCAIRRHDPGLADRLAETVAAPLDWSESKAGRLTATLPRDGKSITLASRYDPDKEAGKLVGEIDHAKHACVAVLGFALGYHAARVGRDMKGRGVLVIFEPDLAVLRAALERIDHSAWINDTKVIFADDTTDRAALVGRIEKYASVITQGTKLVTHPASRQLHGEAIHRFADMIKEVLAFCRTNVATALVNSARTCRNLASNLDVYAAGATTNELHGAAAGYPAVCVAAGPSLVKNVNLLRDPAVRDNVVVIAVQTALRPLLDRGIKPDFVTALDYSQICARFYENLPELPDVTLVAEPKAHPTILDSFPGPVRVIRSQFNDDLLGELARPIVPLKSGATVAHLSFYLAQHLGCDPILFIGQDLGFSDGLYYAPGTAVHRVWSGELNPFNTIEMMEWQRVVRMRGHLRRAEDIHGRPIFSDEQMATYLKQFERDFAGANEAVIDCTEGGMPKDHTTRMPFAEALERHAARPVPPLPVPPRELDADRLRAVRGLLHDRRGQIRELRRVTQQTIPILNQMQRHQRDAAQMKKLFARLQKNQRRVEGDLNRAFKVVMTLNTIGAFKRQRADRAIGHLTGDPYERQSHQIERDAENLEWLIQACDEALDIFHDAAARVEGRLEQENRKTGKQEIEVAARAA